MAQRRMFSLKVVDTDAFLDMPQSSQLLYFHLSMRADDDGFVANPKKIMRVMGGAEDDYKVLIAKRFIIPFDSGVCVIKHWRIHNLIRVDRYTETQWIREKEMLLIDDKTNKYSLKDGSRIDVIPNGNQMAPQVRLGKVRLGKVKELAETSSAGKEINELIFLFKEVNPSIEKYYGNITQRKAVERMLAKFGREKLEAIIKSLPKINEMKYWPKSTTPNQLEDNLGKYKALNDEKKADKNIIGIAL